MKTLHLNLMKKWFDMILNLIKPEEYRHISPYFCSKFLLCNGKHKKAEFWAHMYLFCDNKMLHTSIAQLKLHGELGMVSWKKYDTVTFSNGMTPPVPRFAIKLLKFDIGTGNPDWGAEPEQIYFILKLGHINEDRKDSKDRT